MSLKAFHLIFIICSILMAFVFAAWALVEYTRQGGILYGIYCLLGVTCGALLIRYSRFFLQKLKHISYL